MYSQDLSPIWTSFVWVCVGYGRLLWRPNVVPNNMCWVSMWHVFVWTPLAIAVREAINTPVQHRPRNVSAIDSTSFQSVHIEMNITCKCHFAILRRCSCQGSCAPFPPCQESSNPSTRQNAPWGQFWDLPGAGCSRGPPKRVGDPGDFPGRRSGLKAGDRVSFQLVFQGDQPIAAPRHSGLFQLLGEGAKEGPLKKRRSQDC